MRRPEFLRAIPPIIEGVKTMAKNTATESAPTSKGLNFTIARRVVVPTMKVGSDPIFVQFEQPIEVRQKQEDDGKGNMIEKTIEIGRVTNLETGEIVEIVIGTVLHSELNGAYADNAYVGKQFRIVKKDVPNKRYKAYELDEIKLI
jgi:hypothetical protein